LQSFTISFAERDFDESSLAEATAKHWNTRHERIVITSDEVLRDLPQALAAMDQPTIDGINTWYVSRATKQAGVTVALSGLGGDELFAGYSLFRWLPPLMAWNQRLQRLPEGLRHVGANTIGRFLGDSRYRPRLMALLGNEAPFAHPYFLARIWFTPAQQQMLLDWTALELEDTEPQRWQAWVNTCLSHAESYDAIGTVSYLELTQYMLSRLLRDTDFMSMAHSLEVRVPLLDHLLAEFVIGIPGQLKHKPRASKPLLVNALGGMLPGEVVNSRKRTFTFPWDSWLKGKLRKELASTLCYLDGPLADVLHRDGVRAVWDGFLAGQYSWSRPWGLYVLHHWCRAHL